MNITERLLDLKEQIEEDKQAKDRLEGKAEQMLETLKEKHGCSNIKQAKTKIEKLKTERNKKKRKLESFVDKIEEKLEASYD